MSVETEENPFRPGGDLSNEAEVVIKSSTISRNQVIIKDPLINGDANDSGARSVHFVGNGDQTDAPEDSSGLVTAEVTSEMIKSATPEEPANVEHVTIETKSNKCCSIL